MSHIRLTPRSHARHRVHEMTKTTDCAEKRGEIEMDCGEVKHERAFQAGGSANRGCNDAFTTGIKLLAGCDVDHTSACNESTLALEALGSLLKEGPYRRNPVILSRFLTILTNVEPIEEGAIHLRKGRVASRANTRSMPDTQAAELRIVKVLIRGLLDGDRDRLLTWLQARYDVRGRERPGYTEATFEREL